MKSTTLLVTTIGCLSVALIATLAFKMGEEAGKSSAWKEVRIDVTNEAHRKEWCNALFYYPSVEQIYNQLRANLENDRPLALRVIGENAVTPVWPSPREYAWRRLMTVHNAITAMCEENIPSELMDDRWDNFLPTEDLPWVFDADWWAEQSRTHR